MLLCTWVFLGCFFFYLTWKDTEWTSQTYTDVMVCSMLNLWRKILSSELCQINERISLQFRSILIFSLQKENYTHIFCSKFSVAVKPLKKGEIYSPVHYIGWILRELKSSESEETTPLKEKRWTFLRDRTNIFVRDFLCAERIPAFLTAVVRRMHIFNLFESFIQRKATGTCRTVRILVPWPNKTHIDKCEDIEHRFVHSRRIFLGIF